MGDVSSASTDNVCAVLSARNAARGVLVLDVVQTTPSSCVLPSDAPDSTSTPRTLPDKALDTEWVGVPVRYLWEQIEPDPSATHVLISAYHGFTANLPIDDFLREGSLFAHTFSGSPLEPDHGYPLRLVVPHLYFWKSVKWVRGFSLMDADEPGFWERNGYHMRGDPFQEQRFWGD